MKDNLSNETRSSVDYLDIEPEVKIGLNGYAYDWLDEASLKNYKLNAKIEKNLKKVKEARLILNQLATAGETNIQPLNQKINRIDMGRLFEGVNYKKNLEKKIADFLR